MKATEKKLVYFLTNPEMSDREFHELARLFRSRRLDELLESAWSFRQHISGPRYHESDLPDINSTVIDRIENLLINEAGLTKAAAIELLAKRLEFSERLPSRVSFSAALETLLKNTSGSRVLSAAQRIRNELAHDSPPHDWPLEDKP